MSRDSMRLLRLADPAQHAYLETPRRRLRRSRWTAIAVAGALIVAGSAGAHAIGVTDQPLQAALTSPAEIGSATLGIDETNLDVNDPDIAKVAAKYMDAYPVPPDVSKTEAFAPVIATFPIPEGEGLNHATEQHPRWGEYFTGISYRPLDVPEPELANTALAISEPSLSGMVALSAANAWYKYWLGANPQQRRQAQPVLDAIATWPDLAYRLGCTDRTTCPGRIIELAAIAQAASDGNSAPMRRWLARF